MFTKKLFCSTKYLSSSIKIQIIPLWRKKRQYLTAKCSRIVQTIYFGRCPSQSPISCAMDYVAVYFSQWHLKSVSKSSQRFSTWLAECMVPHFSCTHYICLYILYLPNTNSLGISLSGHGHSTKIQYKCLNMSSPLTQKLPGAFPQGGEGAVYHSHFLVVLERYLTAEPHLSPCVIHCMRP